MNLKLMKFALGEKEEDSLKTIFFNFQFSILNAQLLKAAVGSSFLLIITP